MTVTILFFLIKPCALLEVKSRKTFTYIPPVEKILCKGQECICFVAFYGALCEISNSGRRNRFEAQEFFLWSITHDLMLSHNACVCERFFFLFLYEQINHHKEILNPSSNRCNQDIGLRFNPLNAGWTEVFTPFNLQLCGVVAASFMFVGIFFMDFT